jgi:hypothetical protein
LVCSDCVPPQTGGEALQRDAHDVVERLLRGQRDAAVCVWKRIICDFGFLAPKRSA